MSTETAEPLMLTAAEVAARLGLSRRMVYDLARRGELPSYRFGDALRFAPADVQEYKTKCRSAGTPGTSVGASSSTATLRAADTDLADFFRGVGVKPRLTRTTGKKAPASPRLRLAFSETSR